ncbi:MAG: DUF2752 domain-containing protein [Planctomycetaceae bacterium]|nr:DUF2752 domain-containing protein [Planctomycetaceae bacterium]
MRGEQSMAWSVWRRIVAGLTVLFLVAGGLGLAALEPDARGFGTHQQLGFPGCTLRTLFGIPCPGCGVTTSLALFARGRFVESAIVQPAGFALGTTLMGPSSPAARRWGTIARGIRAGNHPDGSGGLAGAFGRGWSGYLDTTAGDLGRLDGRGAGGTGRDCLVDSPDMNR